MYSLIYAPSARHSRALPRRPRRVHRYRRAAALRILLRLRSSPHIRARWFERVLSPRSAFRIAVAAALRSVATSCRKCSANEASQTTSSPGDQLVFARQRRAASASLFSSAGCLDCHCLSSFLYLFVPLHLPLTVRASIGISSFTRDLCNELSRHKAAVDPFVPLRISV